VADVKARVAAAIRALGSLSRLVFRSASISPAAKREAYAAFVLSIMLYGSGCWCMRAELWAKLRGFHHRCTEAMCRMIM